MLDNKNSFLKWGAILIIANLTAVDSDRRFEDIFEKYYSPITGPVMITAANMIGGSAKIASCKPERTERIVQKILMVEEANYTKHNHPSPECRNVAIGHAIETFDCIYDTIRHKEPVVEFVKRQLENPRKSVAKKASRFIRHHRG